MFMNVAANIARQTVEILLVTFLFRFTAQEGMQDAYLPGFFSLIITA
jgi:hypothetical protein